MSTDGEGLLPLPAPCAERGWRLTLPMHRRTQALLVATWSLLAFGRQALVFAQTERGDVRVEGLRQLVEDGFYSEAEERGRVLLEELRAEDAEDGLAAAEASQWLAAALRRTKSPMAEETLHLARRAVESKRELLGDRDPSYAVALEELATLLLQRN